MIILSDTKFSEIARSRAYGEMSAVDCHQFLLLAAYAEEAELEWHYELAELLRNENLVGGKE